MNAKANEPWNLGQGMDAARLLEKRLTPLGYHVSIGGSVLHKAGSRKDLDLLVMPRNNTNCLPRSFIWEEILATFGAQRGRACRGENRDLKDVRWLITKDNQRIDIFFVQ
jgi:hypothetical protein